MLFSTNCWEMVLCAWKVDKTTVLLIDIQKIELQSAQTQKFYKLVRQHIQRVSVDVRLGESITAVVAALKKEALIG